MPHQRWVVFAFLAGALLIGLSVQSAVVSGFAQFAVADQRYGPLTLSSLLAIVSGTVTFFVFLRNQRAVQFTGEVVDELARVTWPSKDETIRASTTVVVTTLMVAALLGIYDFVWKNIADLVLLTEG